MCTLGVFKKLDQHFQVKNVLSGILKFYSSRGVRILIGGVKRLGEPWNGLTGYSETRTCWI